MSLSAFNRHTTGAPTKFILLSTNEELINSSTANMNLIKNLIFYLCKLLEDNLCLFDSTVRMLDCRVVESVCLLTVKGEVEKVLWHPSSQFSLLVSQSFSLCRPTQICNVSLFSWYGPTYLRGPGQSYLYNVKLWRNHVPISQKSQWMETWNFYQIFTLRFCNFRYG